MGKKKKYAPVFFQVYENDSLKSYLEDMALKGWKLKSVGSMFLHFEECVPHRIRYCVEVMEKPSVYASNQTEKLKAYRDFCRDAGWDYAGFNGYLHIFYTEDQDAVLVETDPQERFERICQACRGMYRLYTALFVLIVLQNLYSCYVRRTLLCLNGWVAMVLTGAFAWGIGEFYGWKKQAGKSLEEEGGLPCTPWKFVRRKNDTAVFLIILFTLAPFISAMGSRSSWTFAGAMTGMFVYVILLTFVFSKLLYWIREKRDYSTSVNVMLYWGAALLIGGVLCSGFLALIFYLSSMI